MSLSQWRNAYQKLRSSSDIEEASLPFSDVRKSELELQAHWFNGDFGSHFTTTEGEPVEILQFGVWNHEGGPDFIEASIRIGNQPPRRGAIELDPDVRDWERHGHSENSAYNQVVLHLFFEKPTEHVFTRTANHTQVPQIHLKLEKLASTPTPPAAHPGRCQPILRSWDSAKIDSLLQGAARFRLEQKTRRLRHLEKIHNAHEMLYQSVAVAMGYKENKLPFQLLAQRFPLRRLRAHKEKSDALLFGISGFLSNPDLGQYDPATRTYVRGLWDDWWAQRSFYESLILPEKTWKMGGMRPANHPHRRLGALAAIVTHWQTFYTKITKTSPNECSEFLLRLKHSFWQHHYTLTSTMKPNEIALIGETRTNEIMANIYFPLRIPDSPELWKDYLKLRAPLQNRTILTAAARIFGSAYHCEHLVHQQGLLQIYEDFCLQDNSNCKDCPFPERLLSWSF